MPKMQDAARAELARLPANPRFRPQQPRRAAPVASRLSSWSSLPPSASEPRWPLTLHSQRPPCSERRAPAPAAIGGMGAGEWARRGAE
eukprot:gene25826-23242_t